MTTFGNSGPVIEARSIIAAKVERYSGDHRAESVADEIIMELFVQGYAIVPRAEAERL